MGRSRYRFLEQQPHFLTCTIVNWLPLFSKPEIAQIILDSLDFLRSRQRIRLYGYVVMENHLHLIAAADDLSKEVAKFKSFTARSAIDWLEKNRSGYWLDQLRTNKLSYNVDQDYQMWQEGSHPQAIFSWEMFQQKLEYIHHNPVRRGYVDDPGHWRYSSYRNYAGLEEALAIDWIEEEGEAEPPRGILKAEP
ncbi:REP-associated tyrosine transposase [Leptolyngbya ohadii]|uniref:REP-associated tyrosine transposase n=1 Tax=Leptolyngbya ohadii TaxID=1962290 RepID=UPI000B59EE78|nr:transposase [Leptolyngbya ohadii]